jgi:hypothetical protein
VLNLHLFTITYPITINKVPPDAASASISLKT